MDLLVIIDRLGALTVVNISTRQIRHCRTMDEAERAAFRRYDVLCALAAAIVVGVALALGWI